MPPTMPTEDAPIWGLYAALVVALAGIAWSACVNEQAERQHWQDCGAVFHEECRYVENPRQCEYEYYKECINAEPTS